MKSIFKLIIFSAGVFSVISVNAQSNPEIFIQSRDSVSQHRLIQISFIPGFGTNGYLKENIVNDISLNILAGVVFEVRFLEIGSLLNVVRHNCNGFEVAGIGSFVGSRASGFQLSGLVSKASAMDGVQSAGLVNYTGEANCIQLAGLVNHAKSGTANQVAGLVNNSGGRTVFQIAGLVNHTSGESGIQLSGLVNHAPAVKNLQIAGLVNNSRDVAGIQISGLVNTARYVKGTQIGVVNVADSISGIPIGVFNFIKNGYHKLEISANELFYGNIAYRSGIRQFHTVITTGINPAKHGFLLWTYGAGLGTTIPITPKAAIDIDAVFQNVVRGSYLNNNYLYKLDLGIDWQFTRKTSFYIGTSYNFLGIYLSQRHHLEYFSDISPYSIYNRTYLHYSLTEWIGFKAGFRFF